MISLRNWCKLRPEKWARANQAEIEECPKQGEATIKARGRDIWVTKRKAVSFGYNWEKRMDWRTLCNTEDCLIGSGPRYEMSLCSTHLRTVVTSHTWVLCFCLKYHGSWVTFSCRSGTHFVPYRLIPALFKCLSQHPRSRGKIKALYVRSSVAESAASFWLSSFLPSIPASPASFGLLIHKHSHNAPVTRGCFS